MARIFAEFWHYPINDIWFTKAHHVVTIALLCGMCICPLQTSMRLPGFVEELRNLLNFAIDLQVSKRCGRCTVETIQVLVYFHLYRGLPLTWSHLGLVRMQEIAGERERGARTGETLCICPNRNSTEDLNATCLIRGVNA